MRVHLIIDGCDAMRLHASCMHKHAQISGEISMRPNTARFEIFRSTTTMPANDWQLCLQFGRLIHADGDMPWGYRFIWKDAAGNLRAQRAGARIPSLKMVSDLTQK